MRGEGRSSGREILLFAGTTEGRELAEYLSRAGIACTASVATEYGAQILGPGAGRRILQGRMNAREMEEEIRRGVYACAVDATHPFATEVSAQIRQACLNTGTPCLRLARDTGADLKSAPVYEAASMQEAAEILRKIPGNLFLMTGSKDLKALTEAIGDPHRIYVRVLPSPESLALCKEGGIEASHIIAMQGPFSAALNEAMLRQCGASAVLTKESGKAGGFDEKLEAARAVGIPVVVVKNPERLQSEAATDPQVKHYSYAEVLEEIARITGAAEPGAMDQEESGDPHEDGADAPVEYTIVSAGPGDARHWTREAMEAVESADIVFGAAPIIERARRSCLLADGKPVRPYYLASKVLPFMQEHPAYRKAAVLVSGDAGLYSGAAQLRAALQEPENAAENAVIRCLPGVSSVAALAAALGVTWQDAAILSTHGRERDVVGHLRKEPAIFLLVSGLQGVLETAKRLREAIRNGVLPQTIRIGCGCNLSTEEEEAGFIELEQLEKLDRQGLYILYLENPAAAGCPVTPGMEDTAFTRERKAVPMTKEEVRVLALSRLRLTGNAVLYDIGAGTGSVSVEAARLCPDAQIWAVEKKPEAVRILRENLTRYCLDSVHVVEASAPEGLKDLPAPTHVFIGGSGKALPEILQAVLAKNPRVRIVLTCVTLETLAQAMQAARELSVTEPQVRQIAVTRAETVGPYHMMKAQNPVYIIDFEGRGETSE